MTKAGRSFVRTGFHVVAALAIVLTGSGALGADVEKVRTYRDGDVFVAEIQTSGAWSERDVQAALSGSTIQVDLGPLATPKGKHLSRPEDGLVKAVSVATADNGAAYAKILLKDGLLASSLDGRIRVHRRAENLIAIEIEGAAEKGKAGGEVAKLLRVIEGEGDDSAVFGRLVADGGRMPAADEVPATEEAKAQPVAEKKVDTSKMTESEIPVLTAEKAAKKTGVMDLQRVILTLGVLAVVLGGAVLGLKRWAAKSASKNSRQTKIKILTQHHLGAKKSLAIIQVAGETLLIGVTDHNISMLKTLSLLDEEIPDEVPRNFDGALAGFEVDEEVEAGDDEKPRRRGKRQADEYEQEEAFAMRGLSEIRDVVSTRLKGFKNF